jgi:ABC-type molybdate transport system permease subunit
MNLFLLSTRFANGTGIHTRHLHVFLATLLVGNSTRVKRIFKYLVLAPLKQSVGQNGKSL